MGDSRKTNERKMIIKPPLKIFPDSLIFRDLLPNESDSLEIGCTNMGSSPIPIRFTLPQNPFFTILKTVTPTIPPGLESRVSVHYTCKDDQAHSSFLTVGTQDISVEVPLQVLPPSSRIMLDQSFFKLGSVGISTPKKFSLILQNLGVRKGSFSFVADSENLSFLPQKGEILPDGRIEVTGTFTTKKIGDYDLLVKIDSPESAEPPSSFRVQATATESSIVLMMGKEVVSEVNFDTIYFGQKRVVQTTVVNRSQYKRSFVILPSRDSQSLNSSAAFMENQGTPQPEEVFFKCSIRRSAESTRKFELEINF